MGWQVNSKGVWGGEGELMKYKRRHSKRRKAVDFCKTGIFRAYQGTRGGVRKGKIMQSEWEVTDKKKENFSGRASRIKKTNHLKTENSWVGKTGKKV